MFQTMADEDRPKLAAPTSEAEMPKTIQVSVKSRMHERSKYLDQCFLNARTNKPSTVN